MSVTVYWIYTNKVPNIVIAKPILSCVWNDSPAESKSKEFTESTHFSMCTFLNARLLVQCSTIWRLTVDCKVTVTVAK